MCFFFIYAFVFEAIHILWLFSFVFNKNQKNRSHQQFMLEKRKEFLNRWNFPSNLIMANFWNSCSFCYLWFACFCHYLKLTWNYQIVHGSNEIKKKWYRKFKIGLHQVVRNVSIIIKLSLDFFWHQRLLTSILFRW